jgi:coenzyme PQQ precursor peptide PqqA
MLCLQGKLPGDSGIRAREWNMSWTTPTIVEVCIGMEVTSYQSAKI